MQPDLPEEALSDPLGPPQTPIEVYCIECDQTYDSSRMVWEPVERATGCRGFWCCPTPGCGGMGFGFDIWPVDPDYRDEKTGELFCICHEDDDEENDTGEFDGLDPDEKLMLEDILSDLPPAPVSDADIRAAVDQDMAVYRAFIREREQAREQERQHSRTRQPEEDPDTAPALPPPAQGGGEGVGRADVNS